MKNPKNYLYKIAILFIVIGSMTFLYCYGYYKIFDENSIPRNADSVIIIDVKNIQNHFVVSYLKKPSEWQWNKPKNQFEKLFDLNGFGIKKPDYFSFFHIEKQPITQWFVQLQIEDEATFEKTISEKEFHKTVLPNGMDSYYSKKLRLCIIKHANQILVANIPEKQKQIAIKTAEELFVKKHFLDTKRIEKTIDTDNAATFWIKKNNVLEKDGILNLKLEDDGIAIDGALRLKPKFKKEWRYSQNPNALLAFGFDFELIQKSNILKQHSAQINKLIGFELDSILVHQPSKTELVVNKIIEKKDSAITYDYDDDFNPIKKIMVNTSREPSFCFSIQTANSKKIFDYLKSQHAIDKNDVFVNFPLAKTKTTVQKDNFILEANPLKDQRFQISTPKIGYFFIHLDKLRANDWRFIVAKNKQLTLLKSFKFLTMELIRKNDSAYFKAHLKTKKT